MRKYARIGAAASSKLRPVTLLQGAPHSPRGACYAGWKKAARRLYAAMLLHFLLANSTRLHLPTRSSDCKTCHENGKDARAAFPGPCPMAARELAAECDHC